MERHIWIIFLGLLQIGCSVGPDFTRPAPPTEENYLSQNLPKIKDQNFALGENVSNEWWRAFKSESLNNLISLGLANNSDLKAARAAIRSAEEEVKALNYTLHYPALSLEPSVSRQKTGGINDTASTTYNLYKPTVKVSYTLDIFGSKRQIEAKEAQLDYYRHMLELARLTLSANIAMAVITEAGLNAQVQLTKELIALNIKLLKLVKQQYNLGSVTITDVLSQEAALVQIKANLAPLENNISINRHALAVLLGGEPSKQALPKFGLKDLVLPYKLPLSLPSKLVVQRPDIQAAEASLHIACANIGIATAAFFPNFNLNGSYSYQATKIQNLFKASSIIWDYGLTVSQMIFDGGSLKAIQRSKIATYEQAAEQYRHTVLLALQNVADSLKVLENDAKVLQFQENIAAIAAEDYKLSKQQFALGAVEYANVLLKEQQFKLAKIETIKALTKRYIDTVTLFQSLGGGYAN